MILSRREEQVAQLIASGLTVPQVAKSLHISEHTVGNLVRSLANKIPGELPAIKKILVWYYTIREPDPVNTPT